MDSVQQGLGRLSTFMFHEVDFQTEKIVRRPQAPNLTESGTYAEPRAWRQRESLGSDAHPIDLLRGP